MSLEAHLAKNNELLERNNELLEQLVAAAAGDGGAGEAAEKPKATGKKNTKTKEETAKTEEAGLTHDAVKAVCAEWMAEFKAVEGDTETDARKGALKAALAKLVGKEGALVTDVPAADLPRVVSWIEKQKAKDNGHGAGRLTAPPAAGGSAGGDDDI